MDTGVVDDFRVLPVRPAYQHHRDEHAHRHCRFETCGCCVSDGARKMDVFPCGVLLGKAQEMMPSKTGTPTQRGGPSGGPPNC